MHGNVVLTRPIAVHGVYPEVHLEVELGGDRVGAVARAEQVEQWQHLFLGVEPGNAEVLPADRAGLGAEETVVATVVPRAVAI